MQVLAVISAGPELCPQSPQLGGGICASRGRGSQGVMPAVMDSEHLGATEGLGQVGRQVQNSSGLPTGMACTGPGTLPPALACPPSGQCGQGVPGQRELPPAPCV